MNEQTQPTENAAKAGPSGLHAIIQGRVQGVGFRMFVQNHASRLGLTGWVRNKYNGDVEVWAEGERGSLEQLLVFLRQGPPVGVVTHLDSRWQQPRGGFTRFSVRATD